MSFPTINSRQPIVFIVLILEVGTWYNNSDTTDSTTFSESKRHSLLPLDSGGYRGWGDVIGGYSPWDLIF